MDAGRLVHRARTGAGLSLRQLARRAATSHSALAAYEAGRVQPSVDTLERLLRAAGYELDATLVTRAGEPRLPRGEELAQALELAAQFPARHARELAFPRFARSA
jgi:transcriptional regulator with XRE-family HTH domain